jgi:hypothetical protein
MITVQWYDSALKQIIQEGTFKVHSVFEHAINLVNQSTMMTLVSQSKPKAPLTWVCNLKSFSNYNIKHDMECFLVNDQIHIGKMVLQYDTLPNHSLDCVKDSFSTPEVVLEGCQTLLSWSIRQSVYEGAMGLFHEQNDLISLYFVKQLKLYLTSFDVHLIKGFIGCGHGLTPSGDDVIVGMIAMAYAFNHQGFVHVVSKLIEPRLKSTTDVSQVMLRHALNGRFNDYQSKLIQALSQNKDVSTLASQCSSLGHTSGYDFIVGVLMYYFMIKKGATYA